MDYGGGPAFTNAEIIYFFFWKKNHIDALGYMKFSTKRKAYEVQFEFFMVSNFNETRAIAMSSIWSMTSLPLS